MLLLSVRGRISTREPDQVLAFLFFLTEAIKIEEEEFV